MARSGKNELADLERGLRGSYPQIRLTTDLARGWRIYDLPVVVTGFDVQHDLTLILTGRPPQYTPRVYASDSREFRHVYGDGRLCLWFPGDPPERRWLPEHGLVALLDLAVTQLFKEHYYAQTGKWLAEEIHGPTKSDEAGHEREARDVLGRRSTSR